MNVRGATVHSRSLDTDGANPLRLPPRAGLSAVPGIAPGAQLLRVAPAIALLAARVYVPRKGACGHPAFERKRTRKEKK